MELVIPYTDDTLDGTELRFAIRSMVKHFKALSGVVLVGDKPTWYTGKHLPAEDILGRKEFSIYSKLMQVQGTVLFSNDDIFALKDFDETLPNYWDKQTAMKRQTDPTYRVLYQNCPHNWLNFDVHTPMVIDTTRFPWPVDRPIKTAYANPLNLPGTRYSDIKIRRNQPYNTIKDLISGAAFFSTSNNVHFDGMQLLMNELYPQKSEYER